MMLRYSIFILALLSLSSAHSLDNSSEFISKNSLEASPNNDSTWQCWGEKEVHLTARSRPENEVELLLNTDVCVREESRPLTVDLYLKDVRFYGSNYSSVKYSGTINAIHNLTGNKQSFQFSDISTILNDEVIRIAFPAVRSGDYIIEVEEILVTFNISEDSVVNFKIQDENSRSGTGRILSETNSNAELMALIYDAKEEVLKTGQPIQITFGEDFEIPMTVTPPNYGSYTSANMASLLIIPYEYNSRQFLTPHLLGDTHQGDAARCENNPNARLAANGELQQAEIYTPDQAWQLLNKPLVALNANYFEIRPQLNNTSWKTNLCSTPLGIYFDNISGGPTNGTHNEPNVFFPGPKNYIGNDEIESPVDAMFWKINKNNSIDIVYSQRLSDPAIEQYASNLVNSGYQFIAVAGVGLPANPFIPEPTPDAGVKDSTRIAIGKSDFQSVIYIFQGGAYVNGVDRVDLQNLFYGLGVSHAFELDGGGSSALAIDSDAFALKGANRPASTCNIQGLWCSPITQPSGDHRPVPSWIGLQLN